MYDKVSTNLDFSQREKNTLEFWEKNNIFHKSIENRDQSPLFTFYDGPPTANGKPHIGHIITRVVKDIIPRYKTMKGYKVLRKAGWDTHGLPVELEVEKELGISGKPQIEKFGVEPFIKKCKESVWKYENEWREMSERVGFWVDMEHPYVTYDNDYIESVWWSLKKIWDKGLLYKGHKVVPYCPRCGTALSSHEVAQGYKDVNEQSAYVKFKIKDKENEYFMAWTTTPWTLPSNVALAVNEKETYVKAQQGNEILILAEALVDTVLIGEYKIIEKTKGGELKGIQYEPLFDFVSYDKKCCYVVCDSFVTLTDGTGIVHIAPAFGEDDSKIGKLHDLPFVQLVDTSGKFVEQAAPWKGIFVKDADPLITERLKEDNKLYKTADYEHSYPFCWRCDTHLLYYARDTWFIEMTKVRDLLVKNNDTVKWLPENVKNGRFGNFLENVIDWGLSRERYWGTPLPIWECSCGHRHAIGSIKELKEMSVKDIGEIELHKPYIDEVLIKCSKCGGDMKRVPEVIDCWYDSGSMPFAQWHYPFENDDIFNNNFPADFISEAVDQTRGWFYSLIAISTLLFDKSPYKNVIVLGHVLDKDGQKMSKHKGNVVDPWTVLNKQGADAIRWYFCTNSAPWLPSRFYEDAVNETQRKFMGTLWNTYAFFVLYGNIDSFNPKDYELDYSKLGPLDKWAFSKLNTLIKYVEDSLDNYKITEPARAIQEYVDDLSNWYVRRSRERFWGKDMPEDKVNAYMTLYNVLVTLIKLCAPFVPFMTEEMYSNLVVNIDGNAPISVHLCDFPKYDEDLIDLELERNMDTVLKVVAVGRAARNNAAIKNRQPVSVMYYKAEQKLTKMYENIISEELNVKEVYYKEELESFISYKFKPQLKTLGPKYGKLLPKINIYLANADGAELMSSLKTEGKVLFVIEDNDIELTESDLLIETGQAEGYTSSEDKNVTVVINTVLTEQLVEEGFVREIISKIQTMRKEAGFEVMDRISIDYDGSSIITGVIDRNSEELKFETLCESITSFGKLDGYTKEWSINGENVRFTVKQYALA